MALDYGYILSERPIKTTKRRNINHRKINPQVFDNSMIENCRRRSTSRPALREEFNSSNHESSPSTSRLIVRQRPATVHAISSNLQKQMRENAQKFCQRVVLDKGIDGLKEEFLSLKKPIDMNLALTFSSQPVGTRNRYRDVVCFDKTRVVLKNYENDYIHANYVSSPKNDKKFICTQGPTDATCADFWRMVVQEKTSVVVMLCNLVEKQQKKCSEYFPTVIGQSVKFDNVKVTCRVQKTFPLGKDCVHGFVIKVSGLAIVTNDDKDNTHFVDHYQWLDWPDRGVPPTDLTAINILNKIRPSKYPIVIHCSAGIGRTGSLVMMENVIELFLTGKPFKKTNEILMKIRDQRATSVQTVDQYLYVHRVLLEYFFRLGLLEPEQMPHIKKFVDDYNRATSQS